VFEYDTLHNESSCLQLSLIAAHLQKSNYDLWLKLAGMAIDKGYLRDAVLCTSRGNEAILAFIILTHILGLVYSVLSETMPPPLIILDLNCLHIISI